MQTKRRIGTGIITLASLLFLTIALLTRTVLLTKVPAGSGLTAGLIARSYAVGTLFDLATLAYALIPVGLFLLLAPVKLVRRPFMKPLVLLLSFLFTWVLLFNATAEYFFFDEFATRFNFIAIDYLVYTTEVVGNIRESYPLAPILGTLTILAAAFTFLLRHSIAHAWHRTASSATHRLGLVLLLPAAAALALVNIDQLSFSRNSFANELSGNGIYCLVAAFRHNELEFNQHYVTRDIPQVLARLDSLVEEPNNHFKNPDRSDITRAIANPGKEKHYNIILVVEESLSSEHLGAFGNRKQLTPNLDRLAKESLFFTHLYATGTRTVRGLEALTLSIPPLPGTSLVKRPGNENFRSWGTIMRDHGYNTSFIYGGFGYFDNMNYFFANNGFDVVDRHDFAKEEVTFANAWGVCDEDLFRRTIREANNSYRQGRPFFSLVMTTSNHRPFTFPDGRIDLPSKTSRRAGGVKYADYAIGRLLADARTEPWFANTLFIIVADHCANSAGKSELPIKRYEIPLLVYAPHIIRPQVVERTMSQIDVAPTVLGLLNFSYDTTFLGRDILKADSAAVDRAFISTYQKLGYLQDDRLVVLGPRKEASLYQVDRTTGATRLLPMEEEYLANALGYYQGANFVYKNRLNRIN
jgi:phosphoglycerol transferase MdoB-like AlkP superfamily enzyme